MSESKFKWKFWAFLFVIDIVATFIRIFDDGNLMIKLTYLVVTAVVYSRVVIEAGIYGFETRMFRQMQEAGEFNEKYLDEQLGGNRGQN